MAETSNPLLLAALDYAARGWPVFPCRARPETIEAKGKKPKLYKAKTPLVGNGFEAATTDAAKIRQWWRKWPDAMIGVPTGAPIGLFVVDLDAGADKKTGEVFELPELLDALTDAVDGELPVTLTSATPRGGAHLWFAMPAAATPIGNRGGVLDRIDVRGTGGFVIVPPSFNPDPHESGAPDAEGAAYAWANGRAAAEPSAELVRLVTTPRAKAGRSGDMDGRDDGRSPARIDGDDHARGGGRASLDQFEAHARRVLGAELDRVANAGEGRRNDALNKAAFTLGGYVARGWISRARVEFELTDAARACGLVDDDGERSVEDTIASGINSGLAKPVDESVVAPFAGGAPGGNARPRGARGAALPPRAASRASATDPSVATGSPRPAPPARGGFSQPSQTGGIGAAIGNGGGGGAGEDPAEINRRLSFFPQTDLGNAERFLARYGGCFLYCPALGGWLAWDGRRWNRPAADELVQRAVYETVRAIGAEADEIAAAGVAWRKEREISLTREVKRHEERTTAENCDDEAALAEILAELGDNPDPILDIKRDGTIVRKSDKLRGWGRSSEGSGHLSCIAPIARPFITVQDDLFDVDPFKFNCLNGTLRFWRDRDAEGRKVGRFELLEHDPDDLITKVAPVAFDPAAVSPLYDAMLKRVQPEEDMRRFLHAWAGYNMTGDISSQKIVFNYGSGANGKSTWVDIVALALGDYATTTAIETFLDQGRGKRGDQASPDLADLVGRRMVRTSEPEKGAKWAESLIKLATGGEPMKVRQLNCPFFELKVKFKLTVSGNHKPDLGTDHGIWRRMQLVPWGFTVPESERDPDLPAKMAEELSGILNRLVAGCLDWLANGIRAPQEVLDATNEYREQTDPLGRFLSACVEAAPGERVQSSTLYGVFCAWARWSGENQWKQTGFSRALGERGYRKKQSDTVQWLDIRLVKREEDFFVDDGPDVPPPDYNDYN